MAVGIGAANRHGVLFWDAEAGGGFAGAGEDWCGGIGGGGGAEEVDQRGGSEGERVRGDRPVTGNELGKGKRLPKRNGSNQEGEKGQIEDEEG